MRAMSAEGVRPVRTAVDGNGAYWRDADGTWRDTISGEPVPGATDLTLDDLFPAERIKRDGELYRVVPRTWASRRPAHPLAWVFEHTDPTAGREPIVVPESAWEQAATVPVAMAAPELHPIHLVGVDAVASLLGVGAATVRAYAARKQMPEPLTRLGGSPVWSRPFIERWARTRRGQSDRE